MESPFPSLVQTEDGSFTLLDPRTQQHFHSLRGARQESEHVFIQHGLLAVTTPTIKILEVGYGTGLNALLSWNSSRKSGQGLHYIAYDLYPILTADHIQSTDSEEEMVWRKMHEAHWNEPLSISPFFLLEKRNEDILQFQLPEASIDLIYHDAFSPNAEPTLWTKDLFQKMYKVLKVGGVWVSYCAKGQVRRDLQSSGFQVERLPGPPRKREMLRAIK